MTTKTLSQSNQIPIIFINRSVVVKDSTLCLSYFRGRNYLFSSSDIKSSSNEYLIFEDLTSGAFGIMCGLLDKRFPVGVELAKLLGGLVHLDLRRLRLGDLGRGTVTRGFVAPSADRSCARSV